MTLSYENIKRHATPDEIEEFEIEKSSIKYNI